MRMFPLRLGRGWAKNTDVLARYGHYHRGAGRRRTRSTAASGSPAEYEESVTANNARSTQATWWRRCWLLRYGAACKLPPAMSSPSREATTQTIEFDPRTAKSFYTSDAYKLIDFSIDQSHNLKGLVD